MTLTPFDPNKHILRLNPIEHKYRIEVNGKERERFSIEEAAIATAQKMYSGLEYHTVYVVSPGRRVVVRDREMVL